LISSVASATSVLPRVEGWQNTTYNVDTL